MYFFEPKVHQKTMVKERKIRVGDFVTFARKEYIVLKKTKTKLGLSAYRLLPRKVQTGGPIVVSKKNLKHADQLWRSNLERGDEISVFFGCQWISCLVYGREGKTLEIQPCLNNFTTRIDQDAGIIAKAVVGNTRALWVKDRVQPVIINGACQIERAHGLTFPWTYTSPSATRVEVSGPLRTLLTTVTIPKYESSGYPIKMYKNLTKTEIMHDIYTNRKEHPSLLGDIAHQWCFNRLPIYPSMEQWNGLRYYITQALAHGDDRRVEEMLSVGEDDHIFHRNQWLVRTHLSHPYIDVDICAKGNSLQVKLYHSGIQIDKTSEHVRKVLQQISLPMVYAPAKLTIDAAPEMQYVLSRMLGMEQTPVQLLSTRKINGSKRLVNLRTGFSNPEMHTCGGQLNIRFFSFQKLIRELMKRSPMRTLVVVEANALPMWKDFNIYYGRNRTFKPVTVTTRTMFSKHSRRTRVFDSAERLIMIIPTYWTHAAAFAAQMFRCKVKWAVGYGTSFQNSCIFEHRECNTDLCINLSKSTMQQMGIQFPQVTKQQVIFNVKPDSYKAFMNRAEPPLTPAQKATGSPLFINLYQERQRNYRNMLSLFLEHPEFAPLPFRGEKLDAVEATLAKISKKFGVSQDLLKSRAEETCSVCLETITNAAVTPCGHIFCSTCMKELQTRRIKCPMCRSKIPNFLKLSDKNTDGKIVVSYGTPYRVAENEEWGKKIEFLKKHQDSMFVVEDKFIKKKLKKVFKKTQMFTFAELRTTPAAVVNPSIVSLKPITSSFLETFIGTPWGKDVTVYELTYKLPEKPFGQEFY